MKTKLFSFFFILLFIPFIGLSENSSNIPFLDFAINDDFDTIIRSFDKKNLKYTLTTFDDDQKSISVYLNFYNLQSDFSDSWIDFDSSGNIQEIFIPLESNDVSDIYPVLSGFLGKADQIFLPSNIESIIDSPSIEIYFPVILAWINDDVVYELSITSEFTVEAISHMFSGVNFNPDKKIYFSDISFSVFPRNIYDIISKEYN